MEPAPLPPHERPWRHPSELGPSRTELERDGQTRPFLLAATAVAAIALVATVIAITPRTPSGPNAISATTKPMLSEPAALDNGRSVNRIIAATNAPRLASFAPIPNAVAAAPDAGRGEVQVARSLPGSADLVHVKTDHVTYRVAWGDLAFVEVSGRALVFDGRGDLVARIADGELVVLVD